MPPCADFGGWVISTIGGWFVVTADTVRKAKEPLFQNRILAIPESQSQTEALMIVAQPGNSIFAPTIGATARVVMTKIVPSSAARTVILTNRSPLAFAQVRTPQIPRGGSIVCLLQSFCFLHEFMRCSPVFSLYRGVLVRNHGYFHPTRALCGLVVG